VFIDDSATAELRVETVERVAAANCTALVVVHDFQLGVLRRTARQFRHHVIVKSLTPQIGIMWNDPDTDVRAVRALVAKVGSGRSLKVTDTKSWLTHLSP
jgi:hypothetical protein